MIAPEIEAGDAGEVTAPQRPDVALVGSGESSQHLATAVVDGQRLLPKQTRSPSRRES